VESELGRGSTFRITLAACTDDPVPTQSPTPPAQKAAAPQSVQRILVAEDEPDLREVLQASLSASGFDVTVAATTDEALTALEAGGQDLVVSDLLMPGGGGRRILETVSEMASPPPVLVVTGRAEDAVVSDLLARGAAGVLAKPFSLRALVQTVRETLVRSG